MDKLVKRPRRFCDDRRSVGRARLHVVTLASKVSHDAGNFVFPQIGTSNETRRALFRTGLEDPGVLQQLHIGWQAFVAVRRTECHLERDPCHPHRNGLALHNLFVHRAPADNRGMAARVAKTGFAVRGRSIVDFDAHLTRDAAQTLPSWAFGRYPTEWRVYVQV